MEGGLTWLLSKEGGIDYWVSTCDLINELGGWTWPLNKEDGLDFYIILLALLFGRMVDLTYE